MFDFITVLRALSAMIITNAHYENIYPLSIIANGGLLGDVMFFSISGFCLYKPRIGFGQWYKRRLFRIYPAVWIVTLLYAILGYYSIGSVKDIIQSFVFPTHYHFIRSIVLLYIPYYIVSSCCGKHKNEKTCLIAVLGSIVLIQFIVYIFAYDKTYYHIDSVYEPMIIFLFLESMIIGAIMKSCIVELTGKYHAKYVITCIVLICIYITSKLVFTKYYLLAPFQIINQYILLFLLVNIFFFAGGTEKQLGSMPQSIRRVISYISSITLEIYIVQYALIHWLNVGGFPINFLIVTGAILIVASLVHRVSVLVTIAISPKE